MTSRMADREYLLTDQYKDATKLEARARLHERFRTNQYGWMRWAFDQLELASEAKILELGCGPAVMWAENRARIPAGWKVVLSDLSAGMVEEAQRSLGALRGRFEFMVVDIQALPFEDASFDAVIANHMLYHVLNLSRAFSEVRRVLRPGATFYAATNGRRHMQEVGELARTFDRRLNCASGEYSFSLENGATQLGEWFEETELRRYEDSLAVTEAYPLAAYILSSLGDAHNLLTGDRSAELVASVERELSVRGVFHITKDVGLFVALRSSGS
jgi:ubiquinone/menaquinone biosynthesis C-methylase UbiE